jgi:hypothetical protein
MPTYSFLLITEDVRRRKANCKQKKKKEENPLSVLHAGGVSKRSWGSEAQPDWGTSPFKWPSLYDTQPGLVGVCVVGIDSMNILQAIRTKSVGTLLRFKQRKQTLAQAESQVSGILGLARSYKLDGLT